MYVCIFKNFPIKIFKFKNIRSVFVCGSILNGQVFLDVVVCVFLVWWFFRCSGCVFLSCKSNLKKFNK